VNDLRVAAHTYTHGERRAAESLDMFFPQDLRLRERVEEYIASLGCSLGFNFQSAPLASSLSRLWRLMITRRSVRALCDPQLHCFFAPILPPVRPTAHPLDCYVQRVHFKPKPAVAVRRINELPFDVVCKWKRLLFTASIYMRDLLLCRVCLCVVCRVCPSLWCARALEFVYPPLIVSPHWLQLQSICCLIHPAACFCYSQPIDVLLFGAVLIQILLFC
jgi:hypothetical protein